MHLAQKKNLKKFVPILHKNKREANRKDDSIIIRENTLIVTNLQYQINNPHV